MAAPKRLPLAKQLERDAIYFLVQEPRFYGIVGHALEAELLTNPHARLICELAHVFYREVDGRAGMGLSVVAQRLRQLREIGRMTKEETEDVIDWFEGVLDEPHGDRAAVVLELSRELRRHIEGKAILRGMEVHGKYGSLGEVKEMLSRAERLGKHDEEAGSEWDDDDDARTVAPRQIDRLATGITELDFAMGGGMKRGELGFALGESGAGKSQFLSQQAATALLSGHNPFVITLEVSVEMWKSRLKAATSDIPSELILEGELSARDREQIRRSRSGQLAHFVFCSPTITTAEECWRLFDEANRKLALRGSPHRYDVLIVDYADKLGWPKEFKGTYEGQNHVFEALLHGTRERNVWTWTASQAKRRDKKKSKNGLLRMEDVADSMHKVRNSDVVLTLNPTADYSLVRVLLDKHRTGVSGFLSELMPTNFAYGRLVQPELPNHRGGHIPDDSLTLPFQ